MFLTRRDYLTRMGTGLGMLGLAGVLADEGLLAPAQGASPLAARGPQFPAKARHVIHVYLNGGPSQVDTFDPKPLLKKYDGQPLPAGNLTTERHTGGHFPPPSNLKNTASRGSKSARSSTAPRSTWMTSASFVRCMPIPPTMNSRCG